MSLYTGDNVKGDAPHQGDNVMKDSPYKGDNMTEVPLIRVTSIPELEEARHTAPHFWSGEEIGILERYYGKVSCRALTQVLRHRTMKAIQVKAYQLGLTGGER